MPNSTPSKWEPFRVVPHRAPFGPPLTPPQERALGALVHLCPAPGSETTAEQVATTAAMRHNAAVLVLRSLESRKLALSYEGAPQMWCPTMTGRSRARHLAGPPHAKAA